MSAKLVVTTMLLVLLVDVLLLLQVNGCSNFLVSRGATSDNSTHVAYNSDGQSFYGYMAHYAANNNPPGSIRQIYEFGTGKYLGEIPQVGEIFNVIGNMNEFQVAIGETTFDGIDSLATQPGAIIDYYSLMWLALQQSQSAREAIMMMDQLTREYGYASTGETFSVSDPNEVWHMDFIGKGAGEKGGVWVAVKVPEGYVSGHANQARITTWDWNDKANTMFSADIVDFAVKKGLYPKSADPAKFSFADVFDPITPMSARLCEARVWDLFRHVTDDGFGDQYLDFAQGRNLSNRMPLFVEATRKLSVNDSFWQMRRHYEDSWFDARDDLSAGAYNSAYRARPIEFSQDGQQYAFNRNLGYVGTFFHFVAHSRPPSFEAGGVIWFGVDDTSYSVLVPMYSSTQAAPSQWAYGFGDTSHYEQKAAFWAFNQVANFVYPRYKTIGPFVQSNIIERERQLLNQVAATDAMAAEILKSNGRDAANAFLSNFSIVTANAVVTDWNEFFGELFVRFRDSLVVTPAPPPPPNSKDEPPAPNAVSEGYSSDWYSRIIKDNGEHYKIINAATPELRKHELRKLALISRR